MRIYKKEQKINDIHINCVCVVKCVGHISRLNVTVEIDNINQNFKYENYKDRLPCLYDINVGFNQVQVSLEFLFNSHER